MKTFIRSTAAIVSFSALLTSCTVAPNIATEGVLVYDVTEKTHLYRRVIDLPDQKADELYSSGLRWVGINYVSATDVIKVNDDESDRIIVKGIFSVPMGLGMYEDVHHTVVMEFKDGKSRVIIRDLYTVSDGSYGMPAGHRSEINVRSKFWKSTEDKVLKTADEIEASLKNTYATSTW